MTQAKAPRKVLFVCMGNICRSPTGEGVFKRFVETQGCAELFAIDSAGTIAYHTGELADKRMRAAAENRGYSLDSIARAVERRDLETFDLIVAMDRDNLENLWSLAPSETRKTKLLGEFLPGISSQENAPSVPDPYYGGAAGFDEVIDMIENACPNLLKHCLEQMPR